MLRNTQVTRPLILATSNKGKVLEFQSLLSPSGFTLFTPENIGFTTEVEETGNTFEANALIKAEAIIAYFTSTDSTVLDASTAFAPSNDYAFYPILSDDSGLEVDALNGAPGIYSARYSAADELKDSAGKLLPLAAANRKKLLAAMDGKINRKARFHCVLCYLKPNEKPVFFAATCEGKIAEQEFGEGGFGYDPLFIPEGYDKTFAELSEKVKDELSHRGKAAQLFLKMEMI